jgi:hypothetical protein
MSCKMVRGYGKYFDGITGWYGIGFWRGRQKRFLVAQDLVKVGPMNMVVWGSGPTLYEGRSVGNLHDITLHGSVHSLHSLGRSP